MTFKFEGNTHIRRNDRLDGAKEMMGYGGANDSMWTDNESYFGRIMLENSVFGKEALQLKMVCWMNPHTAIEYIPADWRSVNVTIYHSYGNQFSMNSITCKI